jgi:hypothetical protein
LAQRITKIRDTHHQKISNALETHRKRRDFNFGTVEDTRQQRETHYHVAEECEQASDDQGDVVSAPT